MFLEISQNSEENTCARVSFLKRRLWYRQVLSCEFCKIFKNTFFTDHLRWLLLIRIKKKKFCFVFPCFIIKVLEQTKRGVYFMNPQQENCVLNATFLSPKPLSANPTKLLNTLNHFVSCCRQTVWVCLTILWGWRSKG